MLVDGFEIPLQHFSPKPSSAYATVFWHQDAIESLSSTFYFLNEIGFSQQNIALADFNYPNEISSHSLEEDLQSILLREDSQSLNALVLVPGFSPRLVGQGMDPSTADVLSYLLRLKSILDIVDELPVFVPFFGQGLFFSQIMLKRALSTVGFCLVEISKEDLPATTFLDECEGIAMEVDGFLAEFDRHDRK